MLAQSPFLTALGREAACTNLPAAFYSRVGKDPVLRPLFPGKSLRCATEDFAAFLIPSLDETKTRLGYDGGSACVNRRTGELPLY